MSKALKSPWRTLAIMWEFLLVHFSNNAIAIGRILVNKVHKNYRYPQFASFVKYSRLQFHLSLFFIFWNKSEKTIPPHNEI